MSPPQSSPGCSLSPGVPQTVIGGHRTDCPGSGRFKYDLPFLRILWAGGRRPRWFGQARLAPAAGGQQDGQLARLALHVALVRTPSQQGPQVSTAGPSGTGFLSERMEVF